MEGDHSGMEHDPKAAKRLVQCAMLDRADIGNGDKAISIFMHEHWTADLVARFGPADPPRTIRHWRTRAGRVAGITAVSQAAREDGQPAGGR